LIKSFKFLLFLRSILLSIYERRPPLLKRILPLILLFSLLVACSQPTEDSPAVNQPTYDPIERTVTATPKPTEIPPSPTADDRNVNLTTSGIIYEDEVWRGEIHLTGDITFHEGATLTIEPGTTVYLAPFNDDRHTGVAVEDQYILTAAVRDPVGTAEWDQNAILIDGHKGTIIAVGTEEEPIVFKPEGDNTDTAQWAGITVERGKLIHTVVLYGGRTAIQADGGTGDMIEFAYNEVRFHHWAGIDSHASNVWIHHNVVEGGGHQAISAADGSIVEYNQISASQTCIHTWGSDVVIRNNLLTDCLWGIHVDYGMYVLIHNNTLAMSAGFPEGFYFQDLLIYPPSDLTVGIGSNGEETITILNNIIAAPYDYAIGLSPEIDPTSQISNNLVWETSMFEYPSPQFDEGNFEGNPLFSAPEEHDFSLLPGSPALGSGYSDWESGGVTLDLGAFGGPEAEGWEAPIERELDYREVTAHIDCNCNVDINQGDYLILVFGWSTKTLAQAAQFDEAVHFELWLDEKPIDLNGYWNPTTGPRSTQQFPFSISWSLILPTEDLATGAYRIDSAMIFDAFHTDGVDSFNPGDQYDWHINLIVHPPAD
jgi:hypothetical protein